MISCRLAGNADEVVSIGVLGIGIPVECPFAFAFGSSTSKESISIVCLAIIDVTDSLGLASTLVADFIILEITGSSLTPPSLRPGYESLLIGLGIEEILPLDAKNGEIHRNSAIGVGRDILRIIDKQGEGIVYTHLGIREVHLESGFLLPVSKTECTDLEDAFLGLGILHRDSYGTGAVGTLDRELDRSRHRRVIGVRTRSILHGEIYPVASGDIGVTRLERLLLLRT